MSETQKTANDAGTAKAGEGAQQNGASRTFTQDELNSLLAAERRKADERYAGFNEFKEKAELYDAAQEANKSDLQKAQDELAKVMAERDALKSASERAKWVNEVAEATKVPASTVAMLSGKTKEELEEQAKKLAPDFAESVGSEGGKPANTAPDSKGEFVSALFGR